MSGDSRVGILFFRGRLVLGSGAGGAVMDPDVTGMPVWSSERQETPRRIRRTGGSYAASEVLSRQSPASNPRTGL